MPLLDDFAVVSFVDVANKDEDQHQIHYGSSHTEHRRRDGTAATTSTARHLSGHQFHESSGSASTTISCSHRTRSSLMMGSSSSTITKTMENDDDLIHGDLELADAWSQCEWYKAQHERLLTEYKELQALCEQLLLQKSSLEPKQTSNAKGGFFMKKSIVSEPLSILNRYTGTPTEEPQLIYEDSSQQDDVSFYEDKKLSPPRVELQQETVKLPWLLPRNQKTRLQPSLTEDQVIVIPSNGDHRLKADNTYQNESEVKKHAQSENTRLLTLWNQNLLQNVKEDELALPHQQKQCNDEDFNLTGVLGCSNDETILPISIDDDDDDDDAMPVELDGNSVVLTDDDSYLTSRLPRKVGRKDSIVTIAEANIDMTAHVSNVVVPIHQTFDSSQGNETLNVVLDDNSLQKEYDDISVLTDAVSIFPHMPLNQNIMMRRLSNKLGMSGLISIQGSQSTDCGVLSPQMNRCAPRRRFSMESDSHRMMRRRSSVVGQLTDMSLNDTHEMHEDTDIAVATTIDDSKKEGKDSLSWWTKLTGTSLGVNPTQ